MTALAASGMEAGASPLMEALRQCERGEWAHSSLFIWMANHYDVVAASLGEQKVRWSRLAEAVAAEGLRTRTGGIAAANTVRSTWYRVRKLVAAQRQKAQEAAERAAQEQAAKEDERRARREAARAEAARSTADAARIRERMSVVQENAAWQREQDRRRREQQEQALAARVAEAGKAAGALVPAAEGAAHLVTLDLPRLKGVSSRAYLPHDPTLPPVREGEICRATGNPWEIGDDLPGYPSKRNYEREIDWLRDVGRLLRAKHPTNLTMTREEKYVIRTAEARIPNL